MLLYDVATNLPKVIFYRFSYYIINIILSFFEINFDHFFSHIFYIFILSFNKYECNLISQGFNADEFHDILKVAIKFMYINLLGKKHKFYKY